MQFVRLVVIGFVALSIVYFSVSLYSRSVRKERLEKEFDSNPPEGADEAMREAFIAEGMAEYNSSIRPKLIALVYVVPVVFFSIVTYVINAS